MRIFAKHLSYKNLIARLIHARKNGHYSSKVRVIAENSQRPSSRVAKTFKRNSAQFRLAESSCSTSLSIDQTKALSSNFKTNDIAWQISKTNIPVTEKFPLHLLNKSFSTNSIIWSKKSCSETGNCKKCDPNYDYPHLSKIFGTEASLMRSDAYHQALLEAAKRRAAVEECKTTSTELISSEFERPQVINIKGWGASKTNIKPAPISNPNPLLKVDKSSNRDVLRPSLDNWNADKPNLLHDLKTSKPSPPSSIRSAKEAKPENAGQRKSPNLFAASTSNTPAELRSAKPCPPTKQADAGKKICEPCKPSEIWGDNRPAENHGLKNMPQPVEPLVGFVRTQQVPGKDFRADYSHRPPPANLKKQTDGSCKKDDPCKPSDPCKEELEKLKKHKNKMPTGCVDPKCKKNDKCNRSPKGPYKMAATRNISRRRVLKAAKQLRGCDGKKIAEFVCKRKDDPAKPDDASSNPKKESPCKKTEKPPENKKQNDDSVRPNEANSKQKESPCKKPAGAPEQNSKQKDSSNPLKQDPCKKPEKPPASVKQKDDPVKNNDGSSKQKESPCKKPEQPPASGKQIDDPCGSKHKDPCHNKTQNPNCDRKKDVTNPCGEDPCRISWNKEDKSKGSPETSPCGKDPCKISPNKEDKSKGPHGTSPCSEDPGKLSSNKEDKSKGPPGTSEQKDDTHSGKKKEPAEDKKLDPCDRHKKDATYPKEEPNKNLSKTNTKNEDAAKEKDPCENIKQMEDPSKNKDISGSHKQNAESNEGQKKGSCQDKKPSPCSSRKEEPNKDTRKTSTSGERKEATSSCLPKITGKRHSGMPRVIALCKNVKITSLKKQNDPCKASPSAGQKESSTPCLPKIAVKRDCEKPRVAPLCKTVNISSFKEQLKNESSKAQTSSCVPKISGKRHSGTPRVTLLCDSIKTSSPKQQNDPCKTSPSAKEELNIRCLPKISGKRHSRMPRVTLLCNNMTSSPKQQSDPCKTSPSAKEELNIRCLPKISGKRHSGTPRVTLLCNSIKTSSPRHQGDPCRASPSAGKEQSKMPCVPKISAKRHSGTPRVIPSCNSIKTSSLKEQNDPCKDPKGPGMPKITAKRDCGRPRVPNADCNNMRISSDSLKEGQSKDSCQAGPSAEKKVSPSPSVLKTDSQDCGKPTKSTRPNCTNLKKESASSVAGSKAEQNSDTCKTYSSAEQNVPSSPTTPKIRAKRDCTRIKRIKKSKCKNKQKSLSNRGSLREEHKKDSSKADAKSSANLSGHRSADCGTPKLRKKPNCDIIRKTFSTLATSANRNLSNMIANLPSIRNNICMVKFSSKSGDKSKKRGDEVGKANKCKLAGITVPANRKPVYNPHPKDSLRQCYPPDMDCKKLCKDKRKTEVYKSVKPKAKK